MFLLNVRRTRILWYDGIIPLDKISMHLFSPHFKLMHHSSKQTKILEFAYRLWKPDSKRCHLPWSLNQTINLLRSWTLSIFWSFKLDDLFWSRTSFRFIFPFFVIDFSQSYIWEAERDKKKEKFAARESLGGAIWWIRPFVPKFKFL